ncbi:MAG: tetratricopeptide repeat protein, partial [Candidatus Zixiibacteriota bacterium]
PDSRSTVYYGLGLLAELIDQPKEARSNYQKCFDINPDHLDVKQRIAGLDRNNRVSASALTLAVRYLEEGKHKEAETEFNRAVKESSDRRRVIMEIAQEYVDRQRYEDAIKYYRIWLDTNREDAVVLNDLANCYFKMKQFEEAAGNYKTATELPAAPDTVYKNLGLACASLGQSGKAIIAFRKYLQSKPEDVEIISITADLCMKTGDFKVAMPLYEKSLRTNPRDYHAIFYLSECYLNMGHQDSARIGYNRVLELNADFEPAKKRLAQLEEMSTTLSQ